MFYLKMFSAPFHILLLFCTVFLCCDCQQYDFAAEMTRQCLVPDPVGLVDCVEAKVTLPYLTSWVECTNSLGENVKTSADVVNYRCKSVWEGKGLIPEVFFLKDCVIEKTGLPAKNVSAEVLGAYKECESSPSSQQQRIKTAPVQQQLQISSVEYNLPRQVQAPVINNPPQPIQVSSPRQQIQAPAMNPAFQQFQSPVMNPAQQQRQMPIQQTRAASPFQPQNMAPAPQFQPLSVRPIQTQQPLQQQIKAPVFRPVQQVPSQITQQQILNPLPPSTAPRPQYQGLVPASANTAVPRQPTSYQFFMMYPQPPLPNQQRMGNPIMSQKTVPNHSIISQQQIPVSMQQINSINPNVPYSYSVHVVHPFRQVS